MNNYGLNYGFLYQGDVVRPYVLNKKTGVLTLLPASISNCLTKSTDGWQHMRHMYVVMML